MAKVELDENKYPRPLRETGKRVAGGANLGAKVDAALKKRSQNNQQVPQDNSYFNDRTPPAPGSSWKGRFNENLFGKGDWAGAGVRGAQEAATKSVPGAPNSTSLKPKSVTGWSDTKTAGADSATGVIQRRAAVKGAAEAANMGPSSAGYSFGATPDNPRNFASFKDPAGRGVVVNDLKKYLGNADRPTAGRGSFSVTKMGPTDEQMAKTSADFNANYEADVEKAKRANANVGKITKYSRNRPRGVSNKELQIREDERMAGVKSQFVARDVAAETANNAADSRAATSADAAARNASAEKIAKTNAAATANKNVNKGLSSQALNMFKSKVDDGMGGQKDVFDSAGASAANRLLSFLPDTDEFTVSMLAQEAMQYRKGNPGKAPKMEALARLMQNPETLPDFIEKYGYTPQTLNL